MNDDVHDLRPVEGAPQKRKPYVAPLIKCLNDGETDGKLLRVFNEFDSKQGPS